MTLSGDRSPSWQRSRGWGWIWGADDERGALNVLTEHTVLDALRSVQRGRIYDLGVVIDRASYLAPPHARTEIVAYRTPEGLVKDGLPGFEDPAGISFNTSLVVLSDHAGTQVDGLCHATFGEDRHWYNGFTVAQHGRDFGPERAAAHVIPPIVTSAVLIDVASALGRDELEPRYPITPEDLQHGLARQESKIAVGDAVFVRTGAMRHWDDQGHDHAKISGPDTAGLTLAAARWLVEDAGAVLVGADNSTVEVMPPADGENSSPVHKYLLVDQGVHMGELHYLEELAADGVYRFCYVALTPKVRGATAGFALRPIAIV